MKRIATLALTVALAVMLVACSRTTPDSTAPAETTATPDPGAAEVALPGNANSSASSTSVAADTVEAAPEQLSETEGSGATSSISTTSLALKITEPAPVPASRWQEGVHYTRLSPAQPTGAAPGNIEVTEVFWYGCPHCYALDPYLESWRKQGKPGYVSFVRLPVMWSPGHQAHARMFYTAEVLGKLETLHSEIFRALQVNGNAMNSPALIEQFFTRHGTSQAEYQKASASFAVESSLKRAEELGYRYKVESVPLIIINGKYVSDVGKAGGQQQLLALINELAAREKSN